MRKLTKMELDSLEWVGEHLGTYLLTHRRRKTFEKLEALGGGLITSELDTFMVAGHPRWRYRITPAGQCVLTQYHLPRRE